MPEFMIKYIISSIYDTFGSILAEPRSKEKFIPFVETLLKNEETPLPPSPDDGIAWLNTFSGPNIRFEVIGVLFCFIGRAYQSLADGNPLFQKEENQGMNRRQTSWRMNECADVMGKMCDCTDTVNEIVVAFRVAILVLESSVVGDESKFFHVPFNTLALKFLLYMNMLTQALPSRLWKSQPSWKYGNISLCNWTSPTASPFSTSLNHRR